MPTAITCNIMIREVIDWKRRRTLFVLVDQITDAANSVDRDVGAAFGKLLAQAMDIHFDRVRGDIAR